ncbi:nucleoside-diphosphate sugar epimerase/dehydratase [Candidatus Finniella inopinata]|uniref:Polysaccharide biosynthesis protein n=1 Tax=Candidatus Finniella inopinata TaxID=1696036 RepID=A0A4Q7DIG1_9PROT|nr:hypothetical protein [Candidatus Finniella inopinata]RZI46593.1 hypothetical protein EQU50_03125 [Candidatus Finniella inopinata]
MLEGKFNTNNWGAELLRSWVQHLKKRFDIARNHPNMMMPQTVLVFDTLMAFLSLFIALYLRVGDEFLDYSPQFILKNMVVFSLTAASIFCWMQTHRTLWRYITFEDMVPLALAALLANVLYFPLMILIAQQESMPRSVVVINSLVSIMLLGVPRFLYRLVQERHLQQNKRKDAEAAVPVLLIGCSIHAESFIREAFHSPNLPYDPIALITLDDEEIGRKIHGVPITGSLKELASVLNDLKIENRMPKQLIITHNQIEAKDRRFIAQTARLYGLTLMHLLHHFSLDVVEEDEG